MPTLHGTILDDTGATIHACMTLSGPTFSIGTCNTDSGTYSLSAPSGQYTLAVTHSSFVSGTGYYTTYHATLELTATQSLDITIPRWSLEKVVVTDGDAVPVQGAILRFAGNRACTGTWDATPGLTGTMDQSWLTEGLVSDSSGAIYLPYTACGQAIDLQISPPDGSNLLGTSASIPAGTTEGDIHVTLDSLTLRGKVLDANGQPLQGIRVSTDTGAVVTTDSTGRYSVDNSGWTMLWFDDPSGTYIRGCYSDWADRHFDLTGGCSWLGYGDVSDVTMWGFVSHIEGVVRGSDGQPLAGATVSTLPVDPYAGGFSRTVTTDGTGHYRLDVPQGSLHLAFAAEGYAKTCYNENATGNVSAFGCTSVIVSPGSTVTVRDAQLPRTAVVSGKVILPATDFDPTYAAVCLYSPDWSLWVWDAPGLECGPSMSWTNDAAAYSMPVVPGTYKLIVNWFAPNQPNELGCYTSSGGSLTFTRDLSACTPIAVTGDMKAPTVSITAPGETPVSQGDSPVSVSPVVTGGWAQASVTFGSVTAAGVTSLEVSQTGPDAGNFSLGFNPSYYHIETTATFSGSATVCLNYDRNMYDDPSRIRLYHFDEASQTWVDITTSSRSDSLGSTVCGVTSSFSPFVVGQALGSAQSAQSITFGPIEDQLVGAGPITLGATASSGLPVDYSAAGSCSASAGRLTILGVGSCTVTASQPGNDSWLPAAPVTQTFSVRYRFDGFLQPINDTGHSLVCGSPCPISVFKAGSTIPVKFVLKDANGQIVQAASAPIWGAPVKMGPLTQPITEAVAQLAPTTGTTFAWTGSEYHYNWSTRGLAGGYYYAINVILDDGSVHSVIIGLR